jgi:hypothetical protein
MVLLASEFDKSKYLRAEDLKADKKLRIKEVTVEVIGNGADKEQKLTVWFTNDPRGLVLNKTNNRVLRGAFGDDVSGWKDKIVVVFPTMVEFRGKMVPGLRVRIPPPKQATAGNGQATAPTPKPATVAQTLDEFADETEPEPPAKPAVKSSLADELDDELPW